MFLLFANTDPPGLKPRFSSSAYFSTDKSVPFQSKISNAIALPFRQRIFRQKFSFSPCANVIRVG